jgi:hypothetical protein
MAGKLPEQLGLAARPFQERACIGNGLVLSRHNNKSGFYPTLVFNPLHQEGNCHSCVIPVKIPPALIKIFSPGLVPSGSIQAYCTGFAKFSSTFA